MHHKDEGTSIAEPLYGGERNKRTDDENWIAPNNSAYVASKFGVAGLTQSLAKELGPKGIRVNAVCPVLVKTEGLMEALNDESSPAAGEPDMFLNNFATTQTALGTLPSASQVADLCIFLSSSHAAAITGQSINVDCGVLPN